MAKIIVVDDSRLMRSILKGTLESAGYEVEEWPEIAASEVADRLEAAAADLLITDFQMPGCNGGTLARLAQKAKPDLPVMVITASRDPAMIESLQKLKVRSIVHKPVNAKELLEIVSQLIQG